MSYYYGALNVLQNHYKGGKKKPVYALINYSWNQNIESGLQGSFWIFNKWDEIETFLLHLLIPEPHDRCHHPEPQI